MPFPKIIYNPGTGNVTLNFVRGPQNFLPRWAGRVHDNVSTSGAVRERVVDNLDILLPFEMQSMIIDDDMPGWMSFMSFALNGGTFQFYPCSTLTDFYDCVEESGKWEPKRIGPKMYSAEFLFRILNDAQAPSDPGKVLRRFYGINT